MTLDCCTIYYIVYSLEKILPLGFYLDLNFTFWYILQYTLFHLPMLRKNKTNMLFKFRRGAGTCFGPDVTNQFLQRYNLTTIVRSHECKSDGYEIMHSGNVITVFSASNYYEIGSNRGAYIKFGQNSDRYFVQFTAAASKTRKLTFRQQVRFLVNGYMTPLFNFFYI